MFELKGYQATGVDQIEGYLAKDPSIPVLGVGPCGCGKSRVMEELVVRAIARGKRVGVLTHRTMLTDQLCADFDEAGIPYSQFAAGYGAYDPSKPAVIMSAPTVFSRCIRKGSHDLPDLDLVLVDEAHQQCANQARAVLFGAVNTSASSTLVDGYIFRGASVVGFTATPVMRAGLYGRLVDFGSYSLMRKEKMHQMVKVFAPDEIDVSDLKTSGLKGDYSEAALEKRVRGSLQIYGSVLNEYDRLNPGQLPMILFAPSVATSKWFAMCFCNDGIPVAHLDGQLIGWPRLDQPLGAKLEYMESTPENRAALMAAHKAGEIKGICNRFVLREAVNMPWCYHAILATVMGGLSTYLQAVGRLQRFWPEYDYKILQCHGGHYWRHGSPNEDRDWHLGATNASMARARIEAIKKGEKPEGVRCPRCHGWRISGPVCPHCKHVHAQSVRAVRQVNGQLKHMTGQVYRRGTKSNKTPTQRMNSMWVAMLYRCSHTHQPVSSAVARFCDEARAAGLSVDWTRVQYPPPGPESPEWHSDVNEVWPHLSRKRPKKAKAR